MSGAAVASIAALSGHRLRVLELSVSVNVWTIFAVIIQSLQI